MVIDFSSIFYQYGGPNWYNNLVLGGEAAISFLLVLVAMILVTMVWNGRTRSR